MRGVEPFIIVVLVVVLLYVVGRQISQARADRALEESHQFAGEIIQSAGEGIVVYDRELRYLVWNRFMEDLTGLEARQVIGHRAKDLFPHLTEQGVIELLDRALKGEKVSSPDIRYYIPATQKQGWVSGVYRPHYDTTGEITGVIGMLRDITERKLAEQQIEYQAYHDALTGLANRRLFQEHLTLALAMAHRHRTLVGVFYLDLDHFKLVNDSLGHTVGDTLLKQVAGRLKAAVREGDTVARVGGDEFTIVIQELGRKEDAPLVAQKILRRIAEPLDVDGHRIYVTTSIGITVFPDDGNDAESLLKYADNAMYRAKAEGRNTYQMATLEMGRSTVERMSIESGLHAAMERNEFELLFQPQIDVRNYHIVGMEALLRWRHPERGLLLPASFIHVAEERGYIVVIGDWVLRSACAQAMRFRQRGFPEFRVAVNLSARQFREQTLPSSVKAALNESGLDPRCLELEITESVAMENADLTLSVLSELRRSGVTIAIDDFGTGHSSLSYLKRFPVDALKIDRSFVEDLPVAEDAAIVRSVIQLGHGLNLRVIAEGVETKEQLDFLKMNDCREVQGYYFSYPIPATEFDALFERGVAV